MGKDQTQVDKERWELDKTNVQFGLVYAQGLNDKEEYEASIKVLNELLIYDPSNKGVLKTISDSYINMYEEMIKKAESISELVN